MKEIGMSEDRLEQALQGMQEETVDVGILHAARARVWEKVANGAVSGCVEFQPDLQTYLSGTLSGSRRMLLEDHISRCPSCRASIAGMKGERRVIAMPQRSASRWRQWAGLAAAAALAMS